LFKTLSLFSMQNVIGRPFCWLKENAKEIAKQRRERTCRSILRKQARHTDHTDQRGIGNLETSKKKCDTSMLECLERLLVCLQRNEKFFGLMQELIHDNFEADHHSDLDTLSQEAPN
jgi:hypothetical protein